MEVLYAEVKSRTMEPAHVDTSGVKPQTDCKQQGISSCCQSTPEAQSASAAPTAAVPAVPAVPAEPADPAGDAVSPHTQGQAIAIAAEMDARKAPQDKASPCTSSATDKLQDPDSTSGTSNNTAVSTEQPQGASKAGITDRPADSSLRAASLANATAQQVDMTDGAAAHSIESDGAQQADIADGAAASSIESDGAQQADIAVGVAAHSVASDGGGCRHGQIAGYTWTLPAGVQQEDCVMIWVGPEDAAALTHLQLTFNK